MSHEAKDGENHQTREQAGDGVADGNDDCILVTVPGEAVVGGQGDDTATCRTKGEYHLQDMKNTFKDSERLSKTLKDSQRPATYLCCSIHPNSGVL